MRSNVDCGRRVQWNPRRRTIWQTNFARSSPKMVTRGNNNNHTPTKPRRSLRRAPPESVVSMDTSGPSGSMVAGSSGRKSASKALSVSFGDDHAMGNMRERIAARRKQTKQAADKAEKSMKKARAREGRPRKTQRKRLPTKTAGNLRNV